MLIMLIKLATEPAEFLTPQQIASYITQAVTLFGTIAAIIIAIVPKKIRTPSDNQAREDFAYKLLKDRYDELVAQVASLQEIEKYLRDQGRQDFDREQKKEELIRSLNEEVERLKRKISELTRRQDSIAYKVRHGMVITLIDVYGEEIAGAAIPAEGLGDLEMTEPAKTS